VKPPNPNAEVPNPNHNEETGEHRELEEEEEELLAALGRIEAAFFPSGDGSLICRTSDA
jgi:hypothetical protein